MIKRRSNITNLGEGYGNFQAYYSCPDLLKRGWTAGSIRKFLGDPDATRVNPVFKIGSPMKLYLKSRVSIVEETDAFLTWKARTASGRSRISESSKQRQEVKRRELLRYISSLKIDIPVFSYEDLRTKSIKHYECLPRRADEYDYVTVSKDAPVEFIHRIMVNMLRHAYTSYHKELSRLFGKTGKDLAYALLKNRILAAIAATYPALKQECDNQRVFLVDGKPF